MLSQLPLDYQFGLFITDVIFMPYVLAANWDIHQESVNFFIWNKLHYKLEIELVSGFRSMVGHKVIKVNSFTFVLELFKQRVDYEV